MTENCDSYNNQNEEIVDQFTNRLEEFAHSLSEPEYKILTDLIMSAMDPLERIRWENSLLILNKSEDEYLSRLDKEFGA